MCPSRSSETIPIIIGVDHNPSLEFPKILTFAKHRQLLYNREGVNTIKTHNSNIIQNYIT